MYKMYNNTLTVLTVLLSGIMIFSCSDSNVDHSDNPDMPHFVYLSQAETIVSISDILDESAVEAGFAVTLRYGVSTDKTATVDAVVEPDFSLVAGYNTSNKKSFQPFPSSNLTWTATQVKINSGAQATDIPFTLKELDKLPQGEYLLPITVKSSTASNGFPLHETKKTVYYQIINKSAVLKGRWTFDDAGNLYKATVGKDLEGDTSGGNFSQVEGPKSGKKAVRVPMSSYFKAQHDIGRTVEEYTLMVDLKIPSTGQYYTIFQTDLNNKNDAEIFINGSARVGIGALAYSPSDQPLSVNTWYRLILVFKKDEPFKIYQNGILFHTGNKVTDSRFFLDPAGFILFGDEDGEDAEFDIAEVAIYEGILSDKRIKSLGGAGN